MKAESGRIQRDTTIVTTLIRHLGETVSGEAMAREVGMSRVALHKRIEVLKSQGIPIKSIPRRGYTLEEIPDLLIPPLFLALLKSQEIGRNYHFLEQTDSTNRVARELGREGAPEGTLVVAESQTRGKGRQGRSWFSPRGENLYLSLVLRPSISLLEISHITFLASVALTQVIRERISLEALIKWPNDIYIRGKKVAGILVEMESQGTKPQFLVVGVGLNVNTPPGGFPPEISTRATSLMIERSKPLLRAQILAWFMETLESRYQDLKKGHKEELLRYWRQYNYTLGRRVHLEDGREGWAVGITPQGALLVRTLGGSLLSVGAGDVEVVE
ncbi:MAG: biotin--[acetyl-CoA-carboxylase] ligase [Aquificota bacterium]|nr:MAG: biotin--[acetyl-CoA-carboxylase] ligase [Aquificota bacterium]